MRKYVCRISVLQKEKVGEEWRCLSVHVLNSTARTLEKAEMENFTICTLYHNSNKKET